jgi:hypothetical protein
MNFIIYFNLLFINKVFSISWFKLWILQINCVDSIIFLINFFLFQVHSLTLDWLRIDLHNYFFIFFIGLWRSHDLCCKFYGLVMLTQFFFFFLIDFFSISPSTLSWYKLDFIIFFIFFFRVISISWLGFGRLTWIFFFQFNPSILG